MNILYISKLEGKPWIGPTYSIPKQIASQRKVDNVLWYNLCKEGIEDGINTIQTWRQLDYYLDLESHPDGTIRSLPAPFNCPDLIIVEQGYPYARDTILHEIMTSRIPYIVIPRGELTVFAQKKKRIKKFLGNIVFGYPRFMRRALAIQFLTEQENSETSPKWSKKRIVVPNGTDIPELLTKPKTDHYTRGVFIGRIEPYQKGLDLLIEAALLIKSELKSADIKIDLYGSDFENKLKELKRNVADYGLNDIVTFHDAIYGKEKSLVLQEADIFLTPSRFEGHPTGLLEALSYGLPCLVTTGSNMRSEVERFDAGWTADNTSESIKDALLKMIADKDSFPRKSENARHLAKQYDWDEIAKKAHILYKELLQ